MCGYHPLRRHPPPVLPIDPDAGVKQRPATSLGCRLALPSPDQCLFLVQGPAVPRPILLRSFRGPTGAQKERRQRCISTSADFADGSLFLRKPPQRSEMRRQALQPQSPVFTSTVIVCQIRNCDVNTNACSRGIFGQIGPKLERRCLPLPRRLRMRWQPSTDSGVIGCNASRRISRRCHRHPRTL